MYTFYNLYYLIIIINLSILCRCHFFKREKMDVDIKELYNNVNKKNLGNGNECLISEDEAKIILKEKYNINPDYINIDQNIRFILGKCYPIIYIPALFASRLVATINCPVFKKNFLQFVKMRLFCGNTVCPDETNEIEEYVIFPAIFNSPFQIRVTDNINKFTACQGYFFNFYNSRNECPEGNCDYNDGVRISFYGGTNRTKSESKCGIKSQEDVLYAGEIIPDSIINQITEQDAHMMIQDIRKMGYKDGFSQAGISYDYRRYIHSYKFFETALEYEINRLYRNTGKPVVIISTSHGGLFTLNKLIKMSPELKNKIKCFVPIVPPFSGSSHLLQAYLYGLDDFNTEVNIIDLIKMKIELTYFSESLYFSSAPVVGELRPQYGIINILQKPEYSKLKLAIEELIEVEKECGPINCSEEKIKNMTKNYYEIFGDDFPSLADKDCKLDEEDIIIINKFKNKLNAKYTRKCVSNVYDILKCPFLLYEKDFSYNVPSSHMIDLCGIYNSSLLYLVDKDTCKPKSYKEIFEINEKSSHKQNKNEKISLDTIFEGNGKYPYNYKEFEILLDEYNKNYAQKYNKTLSKEDFETEEDFKKRGQRNAEFVAKNRLIQDLPIPPVDTYLIYGNYFDTDVGFVYDNVKKDKTHFDGDEILRSGGDGTVPNYSSFLTGLKWLYEKKIYNLPQEIKLIEYCSLISKEGNKYAYNKDTFKNKTFAGLACNCLNPDYKSYNSNNCAHAAILLDSYLLEMLKNEFLFDEKNNNFSEEKKNAIKQYNKFIDYEQTCNDALYYLNREDMDEIDWF